MEILFQRHQGIAPKLDAIRHDVVTPNSTQDRRPWDKTAKRQRRRRLVVRLLWQELIFPSRRIWAGLAATWILIFVFNFSQRDPAELMARKSPPPAPEMILTFRQQERLLAELIGPNEVQAVSRQNHFCRNQEAKAGLRF